MSVHKAILDVDIKYMKPYVSASPRKQPIIEDNKKNSDYSYQLTWVRGRYRSGKSATVQADSGAAATWNESFRIHSTFHKKESGSLRSKLLYFTVDEYYCNSKSNEDCVAVNISEHVVQGSDSQKWVSLSVKFGDRRFTISIIIRARWGPALPPEADYEDTDIEELQQSFGKSTEIQALIRRLREANQNLRKDTEILKADNSTLLQSLSDAGTALKQAQERIQKKEVRVLKKILKEKQSLEKQVHQLQSTNEELQLKLSAEANHRQQMKKIVDDSIQLLQQKQSSVELLTKQKLELTDKLSQVQRDWEDMEKGFNIMCNSDKEKDAVIEELQSENKESKELIKHLQQKVVSLEELREAELQRDVESELSSAALQRFEQQREEMVKAMTALEALVAQLRVQVSDKERVCLSQAAEISILQNQLTPKRVSKIRESIAAEAADASQDHVKGSLSPVKLPSAEDSQVSSIEQGREEEQMHTERFTGLEAELKHTRELLSSKESELEAMAAQVSEMTTKQSEFESETELQLARLQNRIALLLTENDSLVQQMQQMKRMEAGSFIFMERLADENNQLHESLGSMGSELDVSKHQIAQLKEAVDAANSSKATVETQQHAAAERERQLIDDIERIKEQLAEKQQDNENLTLRSKSFEQQLQALRLSTELVEREWEHKYDVCSARCNELEQRTQALEADCKKQISSIEELQMQIELQRRTITEKEAKMTVLRELNADVESKLEEANQSLNTITAELYEKENKITTLNEQIEELNVRLQSTESQLQQQFESERSLETRLQDMTQQLQTISTERDDLSYEHQVLTEEVSELRGHIRELNEQLDINEKQRSEYLECSVRERIAKEALAHSEKRLEHLEKLVRDSDVRVDALKEELAATVKDSQSKLSQLTSQLQQSEVALETEKLTVQQKDSVIADMKTIISTLEHDIRNLRTEAEQIQLATVRNDQEKAAEHKLIVEQLKKEIAELETELQKARKQEAKLIEQVAAARAAEQSAVENETQARERERIAREYEQEAIQRESECREALRVVQEKQRIAAAEELAARERERVLLQRETDIKLQLHSLTNELEAEQRSVKELEQKLHSTNEALRETEAKREQLQQSLKQRDNQLMESQQLKNQADVKLDSMRLQLEDLQQQYDELEQRQQLDFASLNTILKDTVCLIHSANVEYEDNGSVNNSGCNGDISNDSNTSTSSRSAIEMPTWPPSPITGSVSSLTGQLNRLRDTVVRARQQLRAEITRRKALDVECNALQSEVERLQGELESAEEELERLHQTSAEDSLLISKLQRDRALLQEEKVRWEALLGQLYEENVVSKHVQLELDELQQFIVEHRQQLHAQLSTGNPPVTNISTPVKAINTTETSARSPSENSEAED